MSFKVRFFGGGVLGGDSWPDGLAFKRTEAKVNNTKKAPYVVTFKGNKIEPDQCK